MVRPDIGTSHILFHSIEINAYALLHVVELLLVFFNSNLCLQSLNEGSRKVSTFFFFLTFSGMCVLQRKSNLDIAFSMVC